MAVILKGGDSEIKTLVCLWEAADNILRMIQTHSGGPSGIKGLRTNLAEIMMDARLEQHLRRQSEAEQQRIRAVLEYDLDALEPYIKQLEAEAGI